jgi:methylmalonyl-CoA mutase
VSLPRYEAWGELLKWSLTENVPGEFPYTAGIYPFKREGEDPTRMFAGEGGPERTNRRFHYVSLAMPAKRLSTAFDSVTLYGHDPDYRPDIYGKIGNSGVSICCLDDAKKLYSGFNLADPKTSVSMTINGPAPMLLGYFMNAAIDQQCEIYIKQNGLEKDVASKIETIYAGKQRPSYQGALPKGNNGLGLMLLGVTGDQCTTRSKQKHSRRYEARSRQTFSKKIRRKIHVYFQQSLRFDSWEMYSSILSTTMSGIFTRYQYPVTISLRLVQIR